MRARRGAPVDLDPVRSREARKAARELDLAIGEIALVDAVQPGDVSVAGTIERAPIVLGARHGEAIARRIVDRMRNLGGVPHDLLWDAAHVYAGAPEPAGLREQHPGAVLGGAPSAGEAAAAAADHDEVIIRHAVLGEMQRLILACPGAPLPAPADSAPGGLKWLSRRDRDLRWTTPC